MIDTYRFNGLSACDNLIHAVTTKSKAYPYAFSLALHTGEKKDEIIENRDQIAKYMAGEHDLAFIVANQTHSDHVKIITQKETQGWSDKDDAIEDCDALITAEKNVMLCILTADCVPVLLYDKEKHIIAAVHAGWKGTRRKIVAKTIAKMHEAFGSLPENIMAAVAPSIGSCCYEVGEDVAKHFFDTPKGFVQKENKYMLDLPYINKKQLIDVGLKEKNIEMSDICTACKVEKFFSYRKEQGCSGRFMSMIAMI